MKKILIAEDDADLRELVRRILEMAGHAVETAPDGEAALERLQRENFDLLLTDVWMPRLTGLELLARLRAEPAPPRVVVMTGDNTPETLLEAIRQQAYQYIAKPFTPKTLEELVAKSLAAPPPAAAIEVVSARPHWVELVVPCELAVVERLQNFMMRLKADLPDDVRESVGTAFSELLLNAIEWGGQLDASRKVRIAFLRSKRLLLYRIADPGRGFRFAGLEHAAIAHPAESPIEHLKVREEKGIRPGGFGLLVTRALVDELLYNETQNEVVFIKYID